jgi:hypothetical protein
VEKVGDRHKWNNTAVDKPRAWITLGGKHGLLLIGGGCPRRDQKGSVFKHCHALLCFALVCQYKTAVDSWGQAHEKVTSLARELVFLFTLFFVCFFFRWRTWAVEVGDISICSAAASDRSPK